MRYLQTAGDWFVNEDTFRFSRFAGIRGDDDIDVPFYSWYGSTVPYNKEGFELLMSRDKDAVVIHNKKKWQLNGVLIAFDNDIDRFSLAFNDPFSSGTDVTLSIAITERVIQSPNGDISYLLYYLVSKNGTLLLNHSHEWSFFSTIYNIDDGIGYPNAIPRSTFSSLLKWGMNGKQQTIIYRNKNIGTSFVWLMGTVAILLDDELHFDSLAVIKDYSYGVVTIDEFFYTINPYVLKCRMILG